MQTSSLGLLGLIALAFIGGADAQSHARSVTASSIIPLGTAMSGANNTAWYIDAGAGNIVVCESQNPVGAGKPIVPQCSSAPLPG